jgi:DNA mismatch repair protein MSH6
MKIVWKGQKKHLINQIKFVHARYRYEIEIANELVKGDKKPEDLVITSNKAGFTRYHTEYLKEMLERLEEKEEYLKEAIIPFVCAIF